MNLNTFTIKAQESVAAAQQLAFENNNQQIETGHLLKVLLNNNETPPEDRGVSRSLLRGW